MVLFGGPQQLTGLMSPSHLPTEGTLSTIHATCHHYSTIPEQFQLLQQRKAELGIVTLEEHLNLEKEKHILQITPMFRYTKWVTNDLSAPGGLKFSC